MWDAINYFLVFLGGFGAVWGYRKFTKSEEKITEFEYAAFSALWGVPIFILWFLVFKYAIPIEKLNAILSSTPMLASWLLFGIGVLGGYVASGEWFWKVLSYVWSRVRW